MTRKRFRNLCIAMCDRLQNQYDGRHVNGKVLKWYRDIHINKIKASSYAEAWEMLKPAREVVGM